MVIASTTQYRVRLNINEIEFSFRLELDLKDLSECTQMEVAEQVVVQKSEGRKNLPTFTSSFTEAIFNFKDLASGIAAHHLREL